MYCSFFGLRCPPFEDRADPQFTYATSQFEEALAAMEYEAHYGQGLTLVLGEAGTGKTQLIRSLLLRLHSTDHAVVVTWPASGEMDLFREACKGFGVTLSSSHGSNRRLARLQRHLSRNARADHRSILIIDQAENLNADNLAQLATLAGLQEDQGRLLNILLAGHFRFRSLMDRAEFARLRQQLFGERILSPLTPTETANYLIHRLRVAGAADPELFEAEAVTFIHRAAEGVPRLVNRMADAAMLAAFAAEASRITGEIAAEVTQKETLQERSMDVREVGVGVAGYAQKGWAGSIDQRPAAWNAGSSPDPEPPSAPSAVPDYGHGADIYQPAQTVLPDHDDSAPGSQTLLLDPAGSVHVKGEALLERLERALARAERFTTTSTASLSQFTAVEKHLSSMTAGAERLIERLAGAVRQGAESLDRQQTRLGEAVSVAHHRASGFDGQIAKAAELSNDVKEQVRGLERACERADQAESRLSLLAEQFTDKAADVQERVTLLMTSLTGAERAQAKLDGLILRAPHAFDDATQTAHQLEEMLRKSIEKGQGVCKQLAGAAWEEHRTKLHEQYAVFERSAHDLIEAAHEELDHKSQRAVTAVTEAKTKAEAAQEELDKTIEKTERFGKQFTGRLLATYKDQLQDQFTVSERSARESMAEAQRQLDQMVQKASTATADAEQRQNALDARLRESMAEAQRQLDQTVQKSSTATADAEQRQDVLDARLKESMAEAQRQLDQTVQKSSTATADAEQRQNALDARLKESMAKAERQLDQTVQKASTATADAEQRQDVLDARLKESMAEAQRQLDQAVQKASTATVGAEQRQDALDARLKESMAHCERFEATFTEAAISRCREKLQEQLEAHLISQDESIAASLARHRAKMDGMVSAPQEHLDRLEERVGVLTARSEKLAPALKTMGEDAERTADQVSQFGRAVQSAQSTVDALSNRAEAARLSLANAVDRSEKLITEVQTTQGRIEAVQQGTASTLMEIGRACERVQMANEQARACEQAASRLALEHATGEETVRKLEEIVPQAAQLQATLQACMTDGATKLEQLDSHYAAARRVVGELSEANTTAHKVVEQTRVAVTAAEQAAKTVQEQTSQLATDVTEGARLHEQLAVMIEESDRQTGTMQELGAASRNLIEAQQSLNRDTDSASTRLGQHLTNVQAAIESGQQAINGFIALAEATENQLKVLADKAARIERRMNEATSKPDSIIESAKSQAAELDQVCAAVRKVFAGLSQTSLAAYQQTQQLELTGQETARRIAELTIHTQHASQTLQEWVKEAVQAQSRLERTLGQCPSIGETHPAETIRRLTSTSPPITGIVEADAGGNLKMLRKPDKKDTAIASKAARAPTGVDQVARLLEQARKAETAAK